MDMEAGHCLFKEVDKNEKQNGCAHVVFSDIVFVAQNPELFS